MKTWTAAIKDIQNVPMKVVRGTLISMGGRIIKRSPVDTGRFRGNWQFTFNSPAMGQLANTSPPNAELMNAANNLEAGTVFYMTNNLPYAERLEFGYSSQAPAGMVRVTLQELEQVLQIEAGKL